MSGDLLLVLGLLAGCVGLFVLGKPRMDVVALGLLVVLPCSGLLSVSETLAGFSDPNVVLIAALFVVGEGLVRTGVVSEVGARLIRVAGRSEARLTVWLMIAVAGLGAFMSSTGVVAIFIPVALRVAAHLWISPGKLLMPLAFAGLMSGMLTLVATPPNMVVDGALKREGYAGFALLSFTPIGLAVLVVGVGYMSFARRRLGTSSDADGPADRRPTIRKLIDDYGLHDRFARYRVPEDSRLVGRELHELELRRDHRISLIGIERPRRFHHDSIHPTGQTRIEANDVATAAAFGPASSLAAFAGEFGLVALPLRDDEPTFRAHELGMAELLIPPESALLGKTLRENEFRSRHRLHVIGLRRGGVAAAESLPDEKLKPGDVLLVVGPWKAIRQLQSSPRQVLVLTLPAEFEHVAPARKRAPQALACLVLMVVLMVTGLVPNVAAALIVCLLMGSSRCLDLESAYKAIHWPSLVLIVGMIPLAAALEKTGGVALAADALLTELGSAGPRALLAGLFVLTAVIGMFISNTATAALMAPVALSMARQAELSPYPFAMTVAIAASAAFMTPISSPVNTLVLGPGRYRFSDFVKVGVPFTLCVLLITVLLVPWLFPLRA